jgi:hypothetical protein
VKVGDELGCWRVIAEAHGEKGVARWRVANISTGEPAEVLGLRTATDARERKRFAETHQSLLHLKLPRLVRTIELFRQKQSSYVVREPLEDATLADIKGPIEQAIVAAIGAQLLPTVLAAKHTTHGALTPEDVGLKPDGTPILAPRARPVQRVGPAVTRWVAPEAFAGQIPDGVAGLYGLGAILYTLATGSSPSIHTPPPPSALRPGIDKRLDEAILLLMSTNPSRRAGALPLLHDLAVPTIDLRPLVSKKEKMPKHLETGQVVYTTGAPQDVVADDGTRRPSASAHRDDPVFGAVVIPADTLSGMDPSSRSVAAGYAEVPLSILAELEEEHLPLVIEAHASKAVAKRRTQAIHDRSGLPVETAAKSSILLLFGALLLLLGGASMAVVALSMAVFGLLLWAAIPLALGAVQLVPALLLVALWFQGRSKLVSAQAGWRRLESKRAAQGRTGLAQSSNRIAALRRQLATLTDLPSTASADLRNALRDIERQLEALATVADTADQALAQVNLTQLETRLAALNEQVGQHPEKTAQRDRLARTVSDLHAVAARRKALATEIDQIDEALDEVAGVLGQLAEHDSVDGALEKLIHTTRLVREAVADADDEAELLSRAQRARELQ